MEFATTFNERSLYLKWKFYLVLHINTFYLCIFLRLHFVIHLSGGCQSILVVLDISPMFSSSFHIIFLPPAVKYRDLKIVHRFALSASID